MPRNNEWQLTTSDGVIVLYADDVYATEDHYIFVDHEGREVACFDNMDSPHHWEQTSPFEGHHALLGAARIEHNYVFARRR